MADLNEKEASQTVKVTGASASGTEDNYLDVDSNGAAKTTLRDPSSGTGVTTTALTGGKTALDVQASLSSGQLVPTITNKLRMRFNAAAAATVGSAYSTMFSRSGTGLFFGFQADFNSANVRIKLTIDSGIVFEMTVNEAKSFQFNDTGTTRMQMGGFLATVGNTFDFSTKYAIPYSSSVAVEIQRSDGTNHTMNAYIIFLTEDT